MKAAVDDGDSRRSEQTKGRLKEADSMLSISIDADDLCSCLEENHHAMQGPAEPARLHPDRNMVVHVFRNVSQETSGKD